MPRARNIKPSIMDNEELSDLDGLTRLLFVYLWMLADREGRLEDRPRRIAAQALPYDRDADIEVMLQSLEDVGFIERYEAWSVHCIQIVNFTRHQTPHSREQASALPSPEDAASSHNLGSDNEQPRKPNGAGPAPLIPDSGYLIPDSGESARAAHPTRPGSEAELEAEASQPAKPGPARRNTATRIPEDFELTEERRLVAEAETLPAERTFAKFVDYWRSASGAKARKHDWDATWRNWCRREADMSSGGSRSPPPSNTSGATKYERLVEGLDDGE